MKAWLAKNPRIRFHYTPTSASWLNQVEGLFGIFAKKALTMNDFPSKTAPREHIDAFMAGWNERPRPFCWTKPATALIRTHKRMLERLSIAVH